MVSAAVAWSSTWSAYCSYSSGVGSPSSSSKFSGSSMVFSDNVFAQGFGYAVLPALFAPRARAKNRYH